jgi:ornithine carbamoyltransferase
MARRAIFHAQEEATRFGDNYVSPEHILLALLNHKEFASARALVACGVDIEKVCRELEAIVPRHLHRESQDKQLTPSAKHIIDSAYAEARELSQTYIGTEHLLVGILRVTDGEAVKVLNSHGVTLEQVRRAVSQISDEGGSKKKEKTITPTPDSQSAKLREKIAFDKTGWRKKSCITLFDITTEQINALLEVATGLKALDVERRMEVAWTYPRTLAMIFEKPSLRTRVSFEAGMTHLRGHAINLSMSEIGLGTRESVEDVAQALSRWVDIISARVFKHETVEELAKYGTIPVINALSDREHPIQAFADLLTLQERCGALGNGVKMAYVGDGNNVLHALLLACAKLGINLSAGCPEGYMPDPTYVSAAQTIASTTGAKIEIVEDPIVAVQGADAVYTDVWTSMGQEEERIERLKVFAPYQVNEALMAHAKPSAVVLHCLPAHRGEEITTEIMEKHGATIYEQAENRLHTQKALLMLIIGL